MCQLQGQYGNLQRPTVEQAMWRLNQIVRGDTVRNEHMKWIADSVSSGKFWRFKRGTQNELLDTLHEFSQEGGEVGVNAERIYKAIMCIYADSLNK